MKRERDAVAGSQLTEIILVSTKGRSPEQIKLELRAAAIRLGLLDAPIRPLYDNSAPIPIADLTPAQRLQYARNRKLAGLPLADWQKEALRLAR